MPSVNLRGWVWIDEFAASELFENNPLAFNQRSARADALMAQWSILHHQDEQESFARQSRYDDDRYMYEEYEEEEENAVPPVDLTAELREQQMRWIEDELAAIGVRHMRPYEHWNEDERYMQYQEEGRFGHYSE